MGTSGAGVPHDGAEALAGDGVPALVVRDGVALVGGAAVPAAAAHRLRLGRFSPRLASFSRRRAGGARRLWGGHWAGFWIRHPFRFAGCWALGPLEFLWKEDEKPIVPIGPPGAIKVTGIS